jgi:hypothetical protein
MVVKKTAVFDAKIPTYHIEKKNEFLSATHISYAES